MSSFSLYTSSKNTIYSLSFWGISTYIIFIKQNAIDGSLIGTIKLFQELGTDAYTLLEHNSNLYLTFFWPPKFSYILVYHEDTDTFESYRFSYRFYTYATAIDSDPNR